MSINIENTGIFCECADSGCEHCSGRCQKHATIVLFRVDMDDITGTAMCDDCSDDAFSSGLFTTEQPDETIHIN